MEILCTQCHLYAYDTSPSCQFLRFVSHALKDRQTESVVQRWVPHLKKEHNFFSYFIVTVLKKCHQSNLAQNLAQVFLSITPPIVTPH